MRKCGGKLEEEMKMYKKMGEEEEDGEGSVVVVCVACSGGCILCYLLPVTF